MNRPTSHRMVLVTVATKVSILSAGFALGFVSPAAVYAQSDDEQPSSGSTQFEETKKRPPFAKPALLVTGMGGYHTAFGDTETAEPPLGMYGVGVAYENTFTEGSPWRYAFGALFMSSTADPGKGFAFFGAMSRAAYYTNPEGTNSLVLWAGLGAGLAGYNVNTFGISIQGGIDYMVTPNVGFGVFADTTSLLAAQDPIDIEGVVEGNDFDGATTLNVGGSLIIRIPI